MNLLAELDQLNLEPAAKTQVAAMLQALVEQAAQGAQTIANQQQLLQMKNASLQAKEVKISRADTRVGVLQAHPFQGRG
jgi:transposase